MEAATDGNTLLSSLSAGKLLRRILLGDESVGAITQCVFPVATTETVTLPYIVYARVGMENTPVNAPQPADTVMIEVDCYAGDYTGSIDLAEAVRAALDGATCECDGLTMRSCVMADASEDYDSDAYLQSLLFKVKISATQQ